MANSNGLITPPVVHSKSGGDIQRVLGLYTDSLIELCTSSRINKWAKYKPVKYAHKGTSDQADAQKRWKSDANWYIGDVAGERYGMRFPMLDSQGRPYASTGTISQSTVSGKIYRNPTSGFFYDLMHNNLRWIYNRPQGGTTQWFRELDFSYYQHRSRCPLPYSVTKTLYVGGATNTKATYVVDCELNSLDDYIPYGLTLADIAPPPAYQMELPDLSECYVGILFYDSTKQDCFWQTSAYKLSALNGTDAAAKAKCLHVSLVDPEFTSQYSKTSKVWKTRAFLCSKQLGWCETFSAYDGPYYLIACDEDETTCTLAVSGVVVVSNFVASRVGTRIITSCVVTNNTQSSVTLTSPKITLIAPIVEGDEHTFSNTTIAAGDSATFSYTFEMQLDAVDQARFTASYSGGSISDTVNVVTK